MFKLVLEKAEEPEIKLPTSAGSWKKQESSRKTSAAAAAAGVGCHSLLQGMKVKSKREVAQSCLTLPNPMDCSLPGSFAHGIFQARVLEWVAIAFSEHDHCKYRIIRARGVEGTTQSDSKGRVRNKLAKKKRS